MGVYTSELVKSLPFAQLIDAIVESINRANRIFKWPEMSLERWLSLATAAAYLLLAGIFNPAYMLGRGATIGFVAFLYLPLRLIWIDGANEDWDILTRQVIRIFAWLFLAAPAAVLLLRWLMRI